MATRVSQLRNLSGEDGSYVALDDRLLVLDFQAGDMEAFVEIHRRYSGLAQRVCGRILSNAEDADEALQETMIRVFQGLHRFNGRYALQPWIARIATNVALDALRARARRPQTDFAVIDEHEREDSADGPERLVERLVERDLIISVLSEMPESHRRALVLRELEGHSHKEIAEDLGVTPAQAKALIHRAKGSFRRRWLIAITERGGLAGIALTPLMWLAKFGGALRRIVDRAGEAGQAAATQAVQIANSSPAVPAATSQTGERVVAAAVTILVAGTMTVGAATLTHRKPAGGVSASPPPAAVVQPSPAASQPRDSGFRQPNIKPAKATHPRTKVPPAGDASPSPSDIPSPTPSPSGEPETSPSGSPVLTPPPTPPAPPWNLDLTSSVLLAAGDFQLIDSKVTGTPGHQMLFSQAAQTDGIYLEYWGSHDGDHGTFNMWLFLDTPSGRFRLDGVGALAEQSGSSKEGSTYRFTGTYTTGDAPSPSPGGVLEPPTLRWGTFQAELHFWPDGTLYSVGLSLAEDSTEPAGGLAP